MCRLNVQIEEELTKAPYVYLQSDDYFPFGQACEEVCHVGVPRWGDVIVAKRIPPGSIKPTGDDHQLWIILVCEGVGV